MIKSLALLLVFSWSYVPIISSSSYIRYLHWRFNEHVRLIMCYSGVFWIVTGEAIHTASSEQLFRTDSIATKMMKASSSIVGAYWLPSVLRNLIRSIVNNPQNVEVDPATLGPGDNAHQNLERLLDSVRQFMDQIFLSLDSAPMYEHKSLLAMIIPFNFLYIIDCCEILWEWLPKL